MGESSRQSWVHLAVLLGIGYALVGIVFAVPSNAAEQLLSHVYEGLRLDEALHQLSARDTRSAELVKRRFFADLTISEAAKAFTVSFEHQ